MRKARRRLLSTILIAALVFGVFPGGTVMAGTQEFETAYSDFFAKESEYSTVWNAYVTAQGEYSTAANATDVSWAHDTYAAAASALTTYQNGLSAVQNAYEQAKSAFSGLDTTEQNTYSVSGSNLDNRMQTVSSNNANLPALDPASVDDFYTKQIAFMGTLSAYWNAVNIFNSDSSTGYKGALEQYEEALANNATNVQELYEAAKQARENCVTEYNKVKTAYDAALSAYNVLVDPVLTGITAVAQGKSEIDDEYAAVLDAYNHLGEVLAPGSLPPMASEYSTIYIDAQGYFDGHPDAPKYWKVNSSGNVEAATETDYSMKFENTADGPVMTLHNFNFTSNPLYDGDAIWCDTSLTLVVEGNNSITGTRGNALGVKGELTILGSGTLTLTSTSGQITPSEPGQEPYTPMALYVGGGLTNRATVHCSSNNPESSVVIEATSKDIINSGTLTVDEGKKIFTFDGSCSKLVKPENQYSSSAEYPVPTDHVYVGKVYYYETEVKYPTGMYDLGEDTSQWTVIGKYAEDGTPLGSKVSYQYWYVTESGGILTEDIVNPVSFLVYEDEPELLLQDKDIVSIGDGESHTFNADLYALWFTDGKVTVNGDIIQDFACFNVGAVEDSGSEEYQNIVRDANGNRVWWVESKPDSSVTVNGDVGLLSLNDSFVGNVTVNGNINLLGFYEDMDPGITTTISPVPETFYGSKSNAGLVIDGGEYVNIGTALEGYLGYCVYNTEEFYAMTQRVINGEAVHGTTAAIGGNSIQVGVTRDVVGNSTFPCVRSAGSNTGDRIRRMLTKSDSNLLVMDISLIQDNARKIEPRTTTNLYFENISGFSRPAVFHIKENGEIEKLFVYDGSGSFGGNITCATNSFSTYFIAEDQELNTGSGSSSAQNAAPAAAAESNTAVATLMSPKTADYVQIEVAVVLFLAGAAVLMMGVSKKKTHSKR